MPEVSDKKKGEKLAPFNPTSDQAITYGLELLNLTPADTLYDLGCGDARFLVEATKRCGVKRCIGIEYDAEFVQVSAAQPATHCTTRAITSCGRASNRPQPPASQKAQHKIEEAGVADAVSVFHENVLNVDLSDATAIFVYLLPAVSGANCCAAVAARI
jgi:hypothetical protein